MFDVSAIPPDARNKRSIAAHLEMYNRTMDTVRVHNDTKEDFVINNDKRVSNEKYVVPSKDRDIGFGRGNNDVPRFIAMRYLDKMGNLLLADIIKKDWDVKKTKFRLEERGTMEERLALRSTDPKLWDEITKKLWIGVVSRYQEAVAEEPIEREPSRRYSTASEEALSRLDMVDSEVGVPTETPADIDAKTKFIESIT